MPAVRAQVRGGIRVCRNQNRAASGVGWDPAALFVRTRRLCEGKFLVLRMFESLVYAQEEVIKCAHKVNILHRLSCVCV